MLETLKESVCAANLDLAARGVVIYTWGNVSGLDRDSGLMVIKPSGISYEAMGPEDMVVVDLESGVRVEGKWKPSSDTETHLALYRAFPEIGGITHTHSVYAVAFAQAGMNIPALGTTHADYFYGEIPCTRGLTREEVNGAYEVNTGNVLIETMRRETNGVLAVPGAIVRNHGPFSWGRNAAEAVYHAVVLEKVAEMAWKTLWLNPESHMPPYILDRHYFRKHGPHAYYGQDKSGE